MRTRAANAGDFMDDTTTSSGSVRSRHKRRRKETSQLRGLERLRSPAVGQILSRSMVVVAILYAVSALYQVRTASYMYGPLMLGMNRSEARYVMGSPQAAESDTQNWHFAERGRLISVGFGPDNRVFSIACRHQGEAALSCPDLLGIEIGSGEDQLWRRLGGAREAYRDNSKTMDYPELNAAFRLEKLSVNEIKLTGPQHALSYLPVWLWGLVP